MTQSRNHTSDGPLELMVVDGVDERVDAAVCEHQYHGELVEPASKVDRVADKAAEKEQDLVWRPTYDESAADHQ